MAYNYDQPMWCGKLSQPMWCGKLSIDWRERHSSNMECELRCY